MPKLNNKKIHMKSLQSAKFYELMDNHKQVFELFLDDKLSHRDFEQFEKTFDNLINSLYSFMDNL